MLCIIMLFSQLSPIVKVLADTYGQEKAEETQSVSAEENNDEIEANNQLISQSIETIDNDTSVKIEGELLKNTSVEIVQQDMDNVLFAYDITIYDQNSNAYEPSKEVEVFVSNDAIAEAISQNKSFTVIHIKDNGETEEIEFELTDEGISFKTESFSIYIIKEHEGDDPLIPRATYHFMDAPKSVYEENNIKYYVSEEWVIQIISNGEKLEPLSDVPSEHSELFYGWYIVQKVSQQDDQITYQWYVDSTNKRIDFDMEVNVAADTEYWVAPLLLNTRFAVFHEDERGGINENKILTKKLLPMGSPGAAQILVSDVIAPRQSASHQDKYFYGWDFYDRNGILHELPIYDADGYIVDTYATIEDIDLLTEDVELYPIYREAHFLNFNVDFLNTGATYVASKFVLSTDQFTSLPVSSRVGYSFEGWYVIYNDVKTYVTDRNGDILEDVVFDNAGSNTNDGYLDLNADVTLLADWEVVPTSDYIVIIWKQNINDDRYAPVESRTYDFVEKHNRSGTTGAAPVPQNSDISKNYAGFTYRGYDSNHPTIMPDGSTVLNIYYDRDLQVVNFYYKSTDSPIPPEAQTAYVYTQSDNGTYGLINGEYVLLTYDSVEVAAWYVYQYNFEPYTGTPAEGSNAYYGVYQGEFATMYYHNGSYYRTRTGNGWFGYTYRDEYTGTIYERSSVNIGDVEYNGPIFNRSGSQYSGYTYTEVTSGFQNNRTYYGLIDNGHIMVRRSSVTQTTYYYNGEVYTGPRYTRSTPGNNFTYVVTWFGLYGQDFSKYGYEWPANFRWREGPTSGTGQTLLTAFTLDTNPYNLYTNGTNTTNYPIYHYTQQLDGLYHEDIYTTAYLTSGSATFNFSNKFAGFQVASYGTSFSQTGGTRDVSEGDSFIVQTPAYVYHERNQWNIFFDCNYPGGDEEIVWEIYYEEDVSEYNNFTMSRNNYTFAGWYADEDGQKPYTFSTMPNANIIVYAKWISNEYTVTYNANGGELNYPSIITLVYGQQAPEYLTTRNYLKNPNGTYVYVDGLPTGTASYYELGTGEVQYEYLQNAYTFMGWYEVVNGHTSIIPYNFSTVVDHDTYLMAAWRKSDSYLIYYNAGIGTIHQIYDPYILQPGTDLQGYADQSRTFILEAPTGYSSDKHFDHWMLTDGEGNPLNSHKYMPGDSFVVDSELADANRIIHFEAVYIDIELTDPPVPQTQLILDANGGTVSGFTNIITEGTLPKEIATNTQIQLLNQTHNIDIHLINYSSYFVPPNSDNILLGWSTNPHDVVPEMATDAVIGIQKDLENILYAIWAIPVYLELDNQTPIPLTITLTVNDYDRYIYEYELGNLDDFTLLDSGDHPTISITIPAQSHRYLFIPNCMNVTYSVSGTYNRTSDKEMLISLSSGTQRIVAGGDSYNVSGTLRRGENKAIFTEDKTLFVPAPTGFSDNLKPFMFIFAISIVAIICVIIVVKRKREEF